MRCYCLCWNSCLVLGVTVLPSLPAGSYVAVITQAAFISQNGTKQSVAHNVLGLGLYQTYAMTVRLPFEASVLSALILFCLYCHHYLHLQPERSALVLKSYVVSD